MGEVVKVKVRRPPSRVVALGKLHSYKVAGRGEVKNPRPKMIVVTDRAGSGIWFIPDSSRRTSDTGGFENIVGEFHGQQAHPTQAVTVALPDMPDELVEVSRIESFVYQAEMEGSSRKGILYEHKVGDIAPGNSGSELLICSDENGRGRYFVTIQKSGYPKVTSRGIEG